MNATYTAYVILFRLCPSHVAMSAEVEGVAKVSMGRKACADMVLLEMKRGVSDNLFLR